LVLDDDGGDGGDEKCEDGAEGEEDDDDDRPLLFGEGGDFSVAGGDWTYPSVDDDDGGGWRISDRYGGGGVGVGSGRIDVSGEGVDGVDVDGAGGDGGGDDVHIVGHVPHLLTHSMLASGPPAAA
jgi:hypothetical protein